MKAELAQLIALQKTDTNIRTLQTDIESIPERRAEIEREFDQRAFEIRGLEQKRDAAFHERARLEKEIFEQKLGAKVIVEKNKGHFTEDDDAAELPEVLEKLK